MGLTSRLTTALLALALLIGTLPAASLAAEPPEPDRTLQDAISLHLQGFPLLTDPDELAASIVDASAKAVKRTTADAQKALDRAIAENQLNLAKAELRALEIARYGALAQFGDPDQECEREVIQSRYQKEKARLLEVVRSKRRIVGDRRGFLRKAWHWIGRPGRRIIRAVFEEVAPVVASGGSVSGGAIRKLAVRAGRRELKNAIVRGLTRQVMRGQPAVVAEAKEQCQPGAAASPGVTTPPAGEPTPKPGLNSGTGTVAVLETYGHPHTGISMEWDHFLGDTCFYYQAYNPSFNNPFLPGINVALLLDLDAGTFAGIIEGPTHATESGWDAWGWVDLKVLEGKLAPQADGRGWDLTAEGPVALSYSMDGWCAAESGPNYAKSRLHSTRGTAAVTGEIGMIGSSWQLDLQATRQAGEEKLRLQLLDIEIGRWGE